MYDEISRAVQEWIQKAQSDWVAAEILLASPQCPADAVCFHCQQYVEKLLKAILTKYSVEAPKTHDLRRLAQLAKPFVTELTELIDASDELTVYGVESRYPGDWQEISPDEMNKTVESTRKFADVLLPKLIA